MKNSQKYKISDDTGSVLKRCESTYKQDFLNMDKLNKKKQRINFFEKETNASPIINTCDNIENINSNVEFNNNLPEKKLSHILNTDSHESNNNNNHYNKKKKFGSFLFQSNIKRNFSPQILKTNVDFNSNLFRKNVFGVKNSQNYIKTNLSNYASESNLLLNNGSSENIFGLLQSKNNSSSQNISQSPNRKVSFIDVNISFKKKISQQMSNKNTSMQTNMNKYKSNSPIKNPKLRNSENSSKKNFIGDLVIEMNNKNDIKPSCPMSPQIGTYNKTSILEKNSSSKDLLINSHMKKGIVSKNKFSNKNIINFSNNYNTQLQNDKNKFLLSSKNLSNRKSSNISEITANIFSKNSNNSSNLKLQNKYKINYTAKSYADLKNNELTHEKNTKSKVSNFKIHIRNIKNKFYEINNNFKHLNNYAKELNYNSRNLKQNNETHHKSLISNNFTCEEINKNFEEKNNSNSNNFSSKNDVVNNSPINTTFKKNTHTKGNILNNNLILSNKGNSNFHSSKSTNNNIFINIKKHLKTKSQINYNLNSNSKTDCNYKINSTTKNINNNNNNQIKVKNFQSTTNVNRIKKELKINWNTFETDKESKNDESLQTKSDINLIEINVLTKERNKLNKDSKIKDKTENHNNENSDNSCNVINCYNDNDILDIKDYETKVSSNAALTVNQNLILTKTTKDDSMNHTIKNINFETSNKKSNIDGPEDLHFFYVNIFQKKRDFAPKFDF